MLREASFVLEELQEDGEAEARRAGLVGEQRLLAGQQGPVFDQLVGVPVALHAAPLLRGRQAQRLVAARRKNGCPKPGGSITFRRIAERRNVGAVGRRSRGQEGRKAGRFRSAERKGEIARRRPDRPHRPQGAARLRRLPLRLPAGPAETGPAQAQGGAQAAPAVAGGRPQAVLPRHPGVRRPPARDHAQAALLHGRARQRTGRHPRRGRGHPAVQDLHQPGQGGQGSLHPVPQELPPGPARAT